MTDGAVTSEPFVTPAGDYLSALLPLWFHRRWPLIVIPLLIMVAVGFCYDSRWLFVALIVAFIIFPMILSGIYAYYMLTPEVSRAVLRKSVTFHPDNSLTITYLPALRRVKVNHTDGTVETVEEEVEPSSPLPAPEHIDASLLRAARLSGNNLVYILDPHRLHLLLIPQSIIPRK